MSATIKDVASLAGVGVGTASRVINGQGSVSNAAREKVRAAIEQLNFSPNNSATNLRRNATKIIALMVPVIDHPFFAKLASYITEEADRYGYSVMLITSQKRVEKEKEIIELIRCKKVDGAIFVTHFEFTEEEIKGCRMVSLDRRFGNDVPYVTTDNYGATYKAVEYLIEKGCKKVGFVGSKPAVDSEVMERERAYRDVMKKHGFEEFVVNDVIMHGDEINVIEEFGEKFGHMDGIFASGYSMALALCAEAQRRGIKIPEDLQIASYDGTFDKWQNGNKLTCIEQPLDVMGKELVRLLICKIRGETVEPRTVFSTKFVTGDTTKN